MEKPRGVAEFIKAGRNGPTELDQEIDSRVSRSEGEMDFCNFLKLHAIYQYSLTLYSDTLLIIDSLNALAELVPDFLAGFLSSLINPRTSLLGTFHTDIPPLLTTNPLLSCYTPPALTILKYLSTTVLTTHCLSHVMAQKRARDRSLVEPTFGLAVNIEGVVISLGANERRGLVVEMEYRRKSGRGVTEWFVMPTRRMLSKASGGLDQKEQKGIILLEEYPPYRSVNQVNTAKEREQVTVQMESTFNLELNEKQRFDRERVILPYLDAQKAEGGAAEGGRILYEMGVEDDFDDEEDEI